MNSVSIVIPTRNESQNIVRILRDVSEVCPDCKVLVVDDSNDNHLTRILAVCNGATVIEGQHKGLGQAIVDGIKASEGDVTVVMDADGSHPPKKIPELISACQNGYSMSIGSRYVSGGSIVGWTLKRKIISLVASAIAYPITRIRDNTSGFFAFSRSILDGVEIQPESWKIMLEVLVKTGAKVKEVPIEFKDREAGKSNFTSKEVINYLRHLYKLASYRWKILNFMLVGGIGYIVNVGLYYPLTLWFKQTTTLFGQEFYLPPFLFSSYVAITNNYLLNKKLTFKDYKVKKLGYVRYLATCSIAIPIEMVMIFLSVRFLGLEPVVAVALVILIVFMLRYLVVRKIVWGIREK